ncbi:MAG: capsule assembly Wzi family protein [Candidatus Sulfotelmatobacter sp.]
MKWRAPTLPVLLIATFGFNPPVRAQDTPPAPTATGNASATGWPKRQKPEPDYILQPGEDPENRLFSPFVKHLVGDQKEFWTSPSRLKTKDLKWILPAAGVLGAFVASDSWLAKQVPASHVSSKTFSDYATYSFIGLGGASFLLGHMNHDDHLSEAGLLASEAAINATALSYAFKEITQRQRPYQGNGHGNFFGGGTSFPSEHSAIAWSVASVWAHEYPGWFSQMAAYGLASAVSMTRVTAKQHFPSDVIVGSLLGWYLSREVYRAHHDPELGGSGWASPVEPNSGDQTRNPANMASPYVPLDSWIYPALDRLAALGYIQSAHLGIRPWTRMACAQMLQEAGDQLGGGGDSSGDATATYRDLLKEFAEENARLNGARNLAGELDSVYARFMNISGPALNDGYHFAQTVVNDDGRPFGQGANLVSGVSARAVAGPLAFYVRAEYQHAPAILSDPPSVQQAIAAADSTLPVSDGRAELNRFDLLEGSVSFDFHNTQFSFGKQSQWLGIGQTGPWLFSNNAEPVLMLKIDDVVPYEVPLLSRLLGPVRSQFFIGQLAGDQFEFNQGVLLGPGGIRPQPYLQGTKLSFKPTPNFEFGMGYTAQFAGPGLPFTWHNFLRTFYAHTATGLNPGKRLSEAEFSYRVPHLRDWLSVYMDSLVVDEYSPIGSSRPNLSPGIYMPQLPKLPKMEFRAEGIKESLTSEFAPGFVYYGADRFRSGYTNDRNLMGNWIGKAGRGGQAWLTYAFSARNSLQVEYRQQEVSHAFLEGGRLVDYSASANFMLTRALAVSGRAQYEQWRFPLLAADRQSNVAASVQLTFSPNWQIRK